ncbi:MAG: hypothetical protein JXR13_12680 [Thalassovita sp.]
MFIRPLNKSISKTLAKAKLLTGLACVVLPQSALALSCLPPDIRLNFLVAEDSPHNHFVVEGRFTISDPDDANGSTREKFSSENTRLEGTMVGRALGSKGRTVPFHHPVIFEVDCFGPYCGRVISDTNMIAFVRQDEDQYVVTSGPCLDMVTYEPSELDRDRVQQCIDGGECLPDLG